MKNNLEAHVKKNIGGERVLTRQERRKMERNAKKYDQRTSFTRDELERANEAAYAYGKQIALEAIKRTAGIGPKRLAAIEGTIAELEHSTFIRPFKGDESNGKL